MPYAGGVLAKGCAQVTKITYQVVDETKLAPVRPIEQLCVAHGVVPRAAALQVSLQDPRIASTVVGVSKPERVAQTLGRARQDVSPAARAELMALPYAAEDPEADRVYRPG